MNPHDILIVAPAELDLTCLGRNARALHFAHLLDAAGCAVTLAVPNPEVLVSPRFRVTTSDPDTIEGLLKRHSVVISSGQEYGPNLMTRGDYFQVFDLAGLPFSTFVAEDYDQAARFSMMLESADLILCASPYQRDFWMGVAAARGMFGSESGDRHPDKFFAVVPSGHFGNAPGKSATSAQSREKISPGDRVFVWNAGYDWFLDPELAINAVVQLGAAGTSVNLIFLPPTSADEDQQKAKKRAMQHAKRKGALDRSVFFPREPLTDAARGELIASATGVISCANDNPDYRFWPAQPLIEGIWARTPQIATRGNYMAGLVEELAIGFAVAPGDPTPLADRMVKLCAKKSYAPMRTRLEEAHSHFSSAIAIHSLTAFLERLPEAPRSTKVASDWGSKVRRAMEKFLE